MSDTERISQPSQGSNDLGSETNDTNIKGVSSGTDTQLHLAAKSRNKHKQNINDDEEVVRNRVDEEDIVDEEDFLTPDETDE
jgi:hypothetical protein